MTDLLLYRLNRVPDRHFVKFLELIGVQLFPPTAANVEVTFWLSSAATDRLTIPSGTEVATLRTATEESIDFTTTHDLAIIPCDVEHVASALAADGVVRDHDAARAGGQTVLLLRRRAAARRRAVRRDCPRPCRVVP